MQNRIFHSVNGFDISTVNVPYSGWETAVAKKWSMDWTVLEKYPNEKAALFGHFKWLEHYQCKEEKVSPAPPSKRGRLPKRNANATWYALGKYKFWDKA